MKLLRAEFENFRLLRGLELIFSTEQERKLTIIRAANETGKTTILNALQWALYGDIALPGKGKNFRLHPIDWNTSMGTSVPITTTVDFEVSHYRQRQDRVVESRVQYRLVRTAYEEIRGKSWNRSISTVKLYRLTERGSAPIESPESIVHEELPPELREVFFTDGDRALSFIEGEVSLSTKRGRVQKAIRSLLGLGVIEDAIYHVKKASGEANTKAKKLGTKGNLSNIASQLESIGEQLEKLQEQLDDAKEQFTEFDERVDEVDRKISEALKKGDKEKLRKNIININKEIKYLDDRIDAAIKEHSLLFKSKSIAEDIVAPSLNKALNILDEMHDEGKIPNTTIPVLEERLSKESCFCGETLEINNADGKRRREHIQKLIDDSRHDDEIQKIITDLFFGAKAINIPTSPKESKWLEEYKKVVENRDGLDLLRDEAGKKLKGLELQLDNLPDTDIQGLREMKRKYIAQRDRFLQKKSEFETKIEALSRAKTKLSLERDRQLKIQKKGTRVLAELTVTQDVIQVLQNSYDKITNDELLRVSELMNEIFLEMIGADPDQGAIIKHAEITQAFDIIVYGPQGRNLDPDRDLNGASRRALTLAFILALTNVSEVEAPNVIDTPLGMMSGFVKRSVLRTAIQKSSQLVLFLTHDEIAGCKDVLDDAAGVVSTLTNPAHYPKMLVNDPCVDNQKIIKCDCTHRDECQICQRRIDEGKILEEMV